MPRLCKAINKNGQPCKAKAIRGSDYCVFHDPDRAAAIAAGRLKGSATALIPRVRRQGIPLRTPTQILDACEDALEIARTDGLTPDKYLFITVQILRVALDAQRLQYAIGETPVQDERLALLDAIIEAADPEPEPEPEAEVGGEETVYLEDLPEERRILVEGWLQEARERCVDAPS
ncbi:MAG: hypothetical protein JW819_09505 [Candidatus Krumholzibacteriota bacterium]|nr:hypothetical protein [Candidatus Krumholzibacteriota bacterium]